MAPSDEDTSETIELPKDFLPERSEESDDILSQLVFLSDDLDSLESDYGEPVDGSRSSAINTVEGILADLPQESEGDNSEDDAGSIAMCNSCGAFISESSEVCNVCGESVKDEKKFVPKAEPSLTEDIEDEQADNIIRSLLGVDKDAILEDDDNRFQADGNLGLCTVCGAFISEDAEACTVCGTHLDEMPDFVPSVDIKDKLTDNKALALCPHCGVFVQEGATECMSCVKPIPEGAKIEAVEIEDNQFDADNASNLLRNFLGVEKSLDSEPIRDSSMSGLDICPDCGAFVSLKAVSCAVCGNSLFDGAEKPALVAEQKMSCPNCDSNIASGSPECPLCGIAFETDDELDFDFEGPGDDITDFLENELEDSIRHLEEEAGVELPSVGKSGEELPEPAPVIAPELEPEETPPEDDLWADDGHDVLEMAYEISDILTETEEIDLQEPDVETNNLSVFDESEPVEDIEDTVELIDSEEAEAPEPDIESTEPIPSSEYSLDDEYKEPLEFIDDFDSSEFVEEVEFVEVPEEPYEEYIEEDIAEIIPVDRDLSRFDTEARLRSNLANWATGVYVSVATICFFLGFYALVPGDYAPGLAVIFGTLLLIGIYLAFTERGTFFKGDLKRGIVFFTGTIFAAGILLHWPLGIFTSDQGAFGQPGLDRLMLSVSILVVSIGILWIRARIRYIFTWFGGIILLFLGTVMQYTYTGWGDPASSPVILAAGLGASLVFISLIFLQYERAIDTSIESDIVRGDAHYLRRNYKGALTSYDDALSKSQIKHVEILGSPHIGYDVPWYSKGSALILMGELEEGIKCLDMALAINPNNEVTWVNKGNAHSKLGEHGVALECYERAISVNPFYEIAWNNLGNIMARQKEYIEALKYYNRSIKINPKYDDAWINKGYVLAKMGKRDLAIKCLSHVGSRAKVDIPGNESETLHISDA